MRNHTYSFDKIVVGGNLSAFIYAYVNNLPLIANHLLSPYFFQEKEKVLWNKMYFLLSLSGLNLFESKVSSIRIADDTLSVATKNLKVAKVRFDELVLFDDNCIEGLPIPREKKSKFMVLDWMLANPCVKHKHEHFFTNDDFVKDIYFYPTERVDGNHLDIKDLVAVSHLNPEQLLDFNYSDTYARFKTAKILKQNGVVGRKNGFFRGKQIHYNLKLKVERREIRKLEMDLYENTENIKFNYSSLSRGDSLLSTYASKLNDVFGVI